jgi:hypothetical protein
MKTTILLTFSFIFTTVSLFGQKDKFEYIDSDIKKEIIKTKPFNPYLKKPDSNSLPRFDSPTLRNLDRFRLYQDSLSIKYDTVKLYSGFIGAEEFPGASRFYSKRPNFTSSLYEISFIIKPDTTVKQYLIIKDPILHTIRK